MVVGNDGVGVVGPVALTGGKIFVYIEIGYPRGAPLRARPRAPSVGAGLVPALCIPGL